MRDLSHAVMPLQEGAVVIPRGIRQDCLDIICERISLGDMLTDIVHGQDDMPTLRQVARWLTVSADFRRRYIDALEIYTLTEVSKVIQIADGLDDLAHSPEAPFRPEDLKRARLRIDTRLKAAEKLLPSIFGKLQTVSFRAEDKRARDVQQLVHEVVQESGGHRLPNTAAIIEGEVLEEQQPHD